MVHGVYEVVEECDQEIPLPTGEGAAQRPVRGTASNDIYLCYPSPGRHFLMPTLSRWERDFLIDCPYRAYSLN
jgi:hypothetical protein